MSITPRQRAAQNEADKRQQEALFKKEVWRLMLEGLPKEAALFKAKQILREKEKESEHANAHKK
jgi:hypothetical protein